MLGISNFQNIKELLWKKLIVVDQCNYDPFECSDG